ncbi:hypothetical protein J6590_042531 [Homalodisca vitripennis]|nr:hypothetical protein J6590_042531 [Homalodisca vitripennis]
MGVSRIIKKGGGYHYGGSEDISYNLLMLVVGGPFPVFAFGTLSLMIRSTEGRACFGARAGTCYWVRPVKVTGGGASGMCKGPADLIYSTAWTCERWASLSLLSADQVGLLSPSSLKLTQLLTSHHSSSASICSQIHRQTLLRTVSYVPLCDNFS